jgi:hypothetical protein
MDSAEAKAILIRYRSGTTDGTDPDVMAALQRAQGDAELTAWLTEQNHLFKTLRQSLRQLTPPPHLRERLLHLDRVIKPIPWWRHNAVWAAAAVIMLLGTVSILWRREPSWDNFESYRARMISTVLREYRMDLTTSDLAVIQDFLATNQAPADYVLPPALTRTTPTGTGLINWREKPVSMLCFDRGGTNMLFLFVIDRDQVRKPPPQAPTQFTQVNKLMTANWSDAKNCYVLAGEGDASLLSRYAPK